MAQVNLVIETGKHVRFQGEHEGRTYDFTLFPVKNDEGKTIQLGVIGRDVTEIRNFQVNLQSAYTDLERKIDERTNELNLANQELIQRIAQHQKAEAQAATLARVTARISAQNDLASILQSVSEETIRSVAYPICSIFLYDDEVDAYTIAAITPPIELTDPYPPIPRSLVEEFIHADTQQIVIPDVREFVWVPGGHILAQFDIRTLVTIPMMGDGEIIGTLNVASAGEVQLPGNEELVFLKALADQAKIGITKIWLLDRLQASSSRLQMLSKKLVLLQEQEHRNLARELHDEIGQSLTSLRLNLDMISRSIPDVVGDQDEFRLKLDRAAQTTTNLLERIREISLDLRPAMLDDLGLLPALVAFFERYTAQTGIQVSFKHNQAERRFSDDLETAIFRIIQEGLTNVARHAACDQVEIRLWADPRFLRLQVEDQGSGFDPLITLKSNRTSGLTGMLERAASCGGVIEYDSFPGKGTCLTAEFPLWHEKAGSDDHIHITGR
jgi:signal transduction histidine kinase